MAAVDKATRDRAVALFNTGGISSNEIAEELGVSSRSVKRWRKEWKADRRGVDVPRAPAPARKAPPPAERPDAPKMPDGPSPTDDPVAYWLEESLLAASQAKAADAKGKGSLCVQYKNIKHKCYQKHLDAQKTHAEEQSRKARSLQRDPRELARRVLRQLPVLLRACPEMAAEVRAQIDAVIPRE